MCIPFDKKTYFPQKKCTNASLAFNVTLLVHTNWTVPRNGWICFKSRHICWNNCHTMPHPKLIRLLPGHLQKKSWVYTLGKARAHRVLRSRERRKSEKSVENVWLEKSSTFVWHFNENWLLQGLQHEKQWPKFFPFIHWVLRYLLSFLCLLSLENYETLSI